MTNLWYNARDNMRYTTMTAYNEAHLTILPAAPTNNYFYAMYLFLLFFHKKASDCSYKNMQNKPNLNKWNFALSSFIIDRYLCLDT